MKRNKYIVALLMALGLASREMSAADGWRVLVRRCRLDRASSVMILGMIN